MPPASQSTLRTMGPLTMTAKTEPTSRKPTTLLTPEHADTMLRAKVVPWWSMVKRGLLVETPVGVARCVHTAIFSMATNVELVKKLRTPKRYFW